MYTLPVYTEEESTPVQAPVIAAERAPEPVPEPARPEPTHYEPEPAQPAQPALSTDQGLCAKALFDYQAGASATTNIGDISCMYYDTDEMWSCNTGVLTLTSLAS